MGNALNNQILAHIALLAKRCPNDRFIIEEALIEFMSRIEQAVGLVEASVRQFPLAKMQKLALDALNHAPTTSFQEQLHICDDELSTIHNTAIQQYNQKQYQEAACLGTLITLLTPKLFEGWLLLGHSEFYLKRYTAALIAYAMAVHTNPSDAKTHLYTALCYERLNEYNLAINAIDLALMLGSQDGQFVIRLSEHKKHLQKRKQAHAKSRR